MEVLIGIYGFFALASLVALVKFSGNPLFIFSLLLCTASLIWLIAARKQEERRPRRRTSRR